jgi:hypothetical protein
MNRRPLPGISCMKPRKQEKGRDMQMRNWTNVFLAAALLAALVLSAPAIGFAEPAHKEHVEAPGVRHLVVEDQNAPIDLLPSKDENTRIEYKETRFIRYEIAREGDTLRVIMHDSRKWYNFIGFQDSGRRLLVFVPESLTDASLGTSNASITVEASRGFASLDLKSSNGKLSLTGATLSGPSRFETSNSGITLKDAVFQGHLTLETSNGELSLEDVRLNTADIRTSNSRISLKDVDAEGSLDAATTNGGIYPSRLSTRAGRLTLSASNGPVEGIINAPRNLFAITSTTSNADNNLPTSWPGGPAGLDVSTSNGRINIEFVD